MVDKTMIDKNYNTNNAQPPLTRTRGTLNPGLWHSSVTGNFPIKNVRSYSNPKIYKQIYMYIKIRQKNNSIFY